MSQIIEVDEDVFNDISDTVIKMAAILIILEFYAEYNMESNSEVANIYILTSELKQISLNLRSKVLNVV